MDGTTPVWIAGLTFAGGVIFYAVRITWALRDLDKELRADMALIRSDVENRSADRDQQISDRDAAFRREMGETFHAMRTKIHEIETWNRDTFVRKESFELVVGRIEKSIEKMGDKLEGRLEKIIDRLQAEPE